MRDNLCTHNMIAWNLTEAVSEADPCLARTLYGKTGARIPDDFGLGEAVRGENQDAGKTDPAG